MVIDPLPQATTIPFSLHGLGTINTNWRDQVCRRGYVDGSKPVQSGRTCCIVALGKGSITIRQGWFLELKLSAPLRWEHCQWLQLFTQTTDGIPPPVWGACLCSACFEVSHHSVWHYERHPQPSRDSKKAFPAMQRGRTHLTFGVKGQSLSATAGSWSRHS